MKFKTQIDIAGRISMTIYLNNVKVFPNESKIRGNLLMIYDVTLQNFNSFNFDAYSKLPTLNAQPETS